MTSMNEKDIFKEQLKSAFDGFEAQVPQDGWEKLEQALNTAARAKIVRRNWYIGSAAAVAVLLIGSLFFLKTPQLTDTDVSPVLSEAVAPQKQNVSQIKDETVEKVVPAQMQETYGSKKGSAVLLAKQETSKIAIPVKEANVSKDKVLEVNAEQTSQPEKETAPQPSQEEIDALVREFVRAGERDIFADFVTESEKKSKPIMLALNAKGGLTSSRKTVNTPMTLRSAGTNKAESDIYADGAVKSGMLMMNAAGNTANNIAEMEHSQPFSVGITVSKEILDNLSVETGLVYTYLSSRAKNTNPNFQNRETQHLHYIGLPLTLNYNLFSIGKLDVYASAGGMVEKAVYGTRQSQMRSEFELTNSVNREMDVEKIKQENLQYSVNAGVGISYPLINNLKLYGKAGGAYYFDAKNNAPTIYSEKKILLDLNAGLRFDF